MARHNVPAPSLVQFEYFSRHIRDYSAPEFKTFLRAGYQYHDIGEIDLATPLRNLLPSSAYRVEDNFLRTEEKCSEGRHAPITRVHLVPLDLFNVPRLLQITPILREQFGVFPVGVRELLVFSQDHASIVGNNRVMALGSWYEDTVRDTNVFPILTSGSSRIVADVVPDARMYSFTTGIKILVADCSE